MDAKQQQRPAPSTTNDNTTSHNHKCWQWQWSPADRSCKLSISLTMYPMKWIWPNYQISKITSRMFYSRIKKFGLKSFKITSATSPSSPKITPLHHSRSTGHPSMPCRLLLLMIGRIRSTQEIQICTFIFCTWSQTRKHWHAITTPSSSSFSVTIDFMGP